MLQACSQHDYKNSVRLGTASVFYAALTIATKAMTMIDTQFTLDAEAEAINVNSNSSRERVITLAKEQCKLLLLSWGTHNL